MNTQQAIIDPRKTTAAGVKTTRPATISPAGAKALFAKGGEFAVLDVREQEEFSRSHMLLASCAPLSRLEMLVRDLVPRITTPVILTDGGEEPEPSRAARAAAVLADLGYSSVMVLQGGMKSWREAGLMEFGGVGALSKGFGEYVEETCRTPRLEPEEVKALLASGANCVVIDVRPFPEYGNMNIPGSICAPGCEVTYRFADLVPDPETMVIVNCAGRTRSIIGAQTLINAGVPNKVAALKGGTSNWRLAGLELEQGAQRRSAAPSAEAITVARKRSAAVAEKYGVRFVDKNTLAAWQMEAGRHTLYIFDVRQPDEYAAGHAPGSRNAPGGQLVQAVDEYAAVRNARYVLVDDTEVRAIMTAHWLIQAGMPHIYVLRGGLGGSGLARAGLVKGAPEPVLPPPPEMPMIRVDELSAKLAAPNPPLCINVGTSKAHRQGHIPGAVWVTRGYLDRAAAAFPAAREIVITSDTEAHARFAAKDAARIWPDARVFVPSGATPAWIQVGLPLETGMQTALCAEDDIWYKPALDLKAKKEDVLGYFAWELDLVANIHQDGDVNFHVAATT